MDNIVGVLQARMASRRLPHKCLLNIEGRPMISIILERLSFSKYINLTVIATTTNKEDRPLVEFAQQNNIGIYRGSQDDIVDRLYQAGKGFGADIIVRVWGDNPLIDPAIVDALIQKLIDTDSDYTTNTRPMTFPLGMNTEVYRLKTLESIKNQTTDPFYREFPAEYIFDSSRFRIETIQHHTNLSDINLSVDYKEDLKLVSYIYKELIRRKVDFHLDDIIRLLSENKEILKINKNFTRNIEYKQELLKRKRLKMKKGV
jgi:spore coat polysaccharide biosynthesis protein SpsF (cytidylyltransferase family)